MVPGVFEDRVDAGRVVAVRAVGNARAGHLADQALRGLDVLAGNHQEEGVVVTADAGRQRLEIILRHRGPDKGHQALLDTGLLGKGPAEMDGIHEARHRDQQVDPVDRRGERQFQRRDHAVGAIGVVDLLNIAAAELDHLRLRLHGDDARRDQIARIAEEAKGHRTDAGRSARDIAADGGEAHRRGEHPELAANAVATGRFQRADGDAGPGANAAGPHPLDPVKALHLEDHPALERHRLAVVPGSAAAHGYRDAAGVAGAEHRDDIRLVAGNDDDVAKMSFQLVLQDRAVPEVVAAAAANRGPVGDHRYVAKLGNQRIHPTIPFFALPGG